MNITRAGIKDYIKKLYSSGALHITVGTFLTKFVAFFGSIFVVRLMNKSEYGLMGYAENIYSYALIFAGLGMSNAVIRFMIINEDVLDKKKHFVFILRTSFLIDMVLAGIVCLYGAFARIPSEFTTAKNLIPIVAILLPFQDLVNEELYTVRSFFKNKLYAVLAFATSLLLIIGRIVGAKVGGASGVLWSRVFLNGLFALVGFFFVNLFFFPRENCEMLSKTEKKDILLFSFQYMITNGFWAVLMLNDTYMLGLLLNNPSELADYKVACVLPGNISIFATAIGTFIAPYFIKNEMKITWIRIWYKKVFVLTTAIVGAVTFMIIVLAKPLIVFMYGDPYVNTVSVMRVLLIGAFINSGLRYTTANLLAVMGMVKYNMIASGVGIVLQLVLDYCLIPLMGVMGVAVSNCIVYLMMAVVLFIVFYRKYYLEKTGNASG